MNRPTAVMLFLLIIGIIVPMQAQIISQNVVGPIYYASLYGVTGDGSTDDYTKFNNLLSTVDTAGGGTIQLPVTGHMTVIKMNKLVIPGNVNIRGCGMYGHDIDLLTPATPACGLDLQYVTTGMEAKLEFLGPSPNQGHVGQNIVENLAITDSSTGINEDCSPSVLITRAVVHFQNVSISGSVPSHYGVAACNDGIILGSNVSGCPNMQEDDCFAGYGSTFYDISFRYTRLMVQFNTAANGTDWNYIFGDYTNGNGNGTIATGPAIWFNATMAGSGGYPYGNVIRNMQIEQGQSGVAHYTYAIELLSNAGTNYFYDIVCSDIGGTTQPCIHVAAPMTNSVHPQMVLGCNTAATPLFPGCVAMDGVGSYPDIVGDLYNGNPAFFARNYYGGNLGSTSHPFNNLNLAVNLSLAGGGSISGTEGVPSPKCGANADFLWADSTALRWKMCNHNGSAVQVVGSGADINASDQVTATHLSSPLPNSQGGTGLNTSASTGVAQVSSGTWSISTALANGTTAFTQTAGDNSTKVATTAYSDAGRPVMIYFFSATGTTGATFFSVGTNDTTESNVEYPMDQLGTITSMTCRTVNVQGAPGRIATLTLDKGGIGCNLTVSWSNINGVQTDSAHNCSYSAGNSLNMSLTVSGGTPNATQYMCTLTGHR